MKATMSVYVSWFNGMSFHNSCLCCLLRMVLHLIVYTPICAYQFLSYSSCALSLVCFNSRTLFRRCIEDHQVECIKRFDVTVTSSAVLRCTTFIYCLLYCGIFLLAAIGHVRFVRLFARLLVVSTPGVYWVVGGSVVFRTFFGAFVCTYLRIVPLFYCYYS